MFDVIIVGAGLVGAGLAVGLASADVSVALVELQPPPEPIGDGSWDPRVYAISPGNADWLADLGVWDALAAGRLQRVERMCIYGDRAGAELEFSAYDAGVRELAWIAENRLLQNALRSAAERAPHVTLISPAGCTDIAWGSDSAVLTLEDGRELIGRLVVGADGAQSWVRERMGVSVSASDYREIGVVCNFTCSRAHEDTAHQWFRSDGVLALLPLPQNRVSMVWSTPEARASELLAARAPELGAVVQQASAGVLGELTPLAPPAGFALRLQHVNALVEPRAALVGDSGHSIHPLAGQGVNLGLRDVRELVQVLRARGARRDCGDYRLLRRYQRARKEDIAAFEATTDGLQKLFGSGVVWMAGLRNAGLSVLDAQPVLKNWLVRRAIA